MYIIDKDPIALKIASLREPLGTLAREKLDEIAREVRGLQHELHCATLSYTGAIDEVRKLRADIERHVAIAADLATEAERLRAELDAARAESRQLRHLLFLAHGNAEHYLYGDDGERACNTCMIDFNIDSPAEIERKIYEYGMKKFAIDAALRDGMAYPGGGCARCCKAVCECQS